MEPLNISAYDKIDILLANTSGAPYEMIKTFKIAHRFDPDRAFNVIVSKLKERYCDEQQIARELKLKLQQFPVIKGSESDTSTATKLRELSDLCIIVKSHMEDIRDLNYYNLPSCIEEIRDKLPHFINTRWRSERAKYEQKYGFAPDFEVFCRFLEESSDIMCSDLLPRNKIPSATFTSMRPERRNARVLLVDNPDIKEASNNKTYKCPLHHTDKHSVNMYKSVIFVRLVEPAWLTSLCGWLSQFGWRHGVAVTSLSSQPVGRLVHLCFGV